MVRWNYREENSQNFRTQKGTGHYRTSRSFPLDPLPHYDNPSTRNQSQVSVTVRQSKLRAGVNSVRSDLAPAHLREGIRAQDHRDNSMVPAADRERATVIAEYEFQSE